MCARGLRESRHDEGIRVLAPCLVEEPDELMDRGEAVLEVVQEMPRRDLVVVLPVAGPSDALHDSGFEQAPRLGADAGSAHREPLRDLVQ